MCLNIFATQMEQCSLPVKENLNNPCTCNNASGGRYRIFPLSMSDWVKNVTGKKELSECSSVPELKQHIVYRTMKQNITPPTQYHSRCAVDLNSDEGTMVRRLKSKLGTTSSICWCAVKHVVDYHPICQLLYKLYNTNKQAMASGRNIRGEGFYDICQLAKL